MSRLAREERRELREAVTRARALGLRVDELERACARESISLVWVLLGLAQAETSLRTLALLAAAPDSWFDEGRVNV